MNKNKKNLSKFVLTSILFLATLGFSSEKIFQTEQGKDSLFPDRGLVTAVYDGDTIKVQIGLMGLLMLMNRIQRNTVASATKKSADDVDEDVEPG